MPVSDFTLKVVRADDLLAATFEFFNLVLDSNTSGIARRLVQRSPSAESRIIVHLPPQHFSPWFNSVHDYSSWGRFVNPNIRP